MPKVLTSVSLFSGCLGLDLGLESAGIHTAAYVESDTSCQGTIAANRPGVSIFADIRDVTGNDIKAAIGRRHIHVLSGGPPCQTFSTIGRRDAMNDLRGRLILDYLRLLDELKPDVFVMENVTGILSATRNGALLFPWLLNEMNNLGYHSTWWKLNASDFGSPQKRKRVIITGTRNGVVLEPQGTHKNNPVTLHEALIGLDDSNECARFSPATASILKRIPSGGNWRSLPPSLQDKAMGNADRTSGGLTAFYRRLSYDQPSPTLLTSPTQRATTLCHPTETRPLSISEYKRIQGFPDDWQLVGSLAAKYRQLGNAVPVQLAEAIGHVLIPAIGSRKKSA